MKKCKRHDDRFAPKTLQPTQLLQVKGGIGVGGTPPLEPEPEG